MARARNIKPGFYRDAALVELPVETRLLFPGLWILADREGRLEDKPKQIKMEIYPADNFDIEAMLVQLVAAGLIVRYEVDGRRYIQVINFNKHQNPHRDEKPSSIPAYGVHDANTVQAPCDDGGNRADSLIPDSLNLIPDSNLTPDKPAKSDVSADFAAAWAEYPKRPGASKSASLKAWSARIKAGADPQIILAGVIRYAKFCKESGTEPQYIKQPATFFGPDEHFMSDWTVPTARASPHQSGQSGRQAAISNYAVQTAAARGDGNAAATDANERDITGEAVRVA